MGITNRLRDSFVSGLILLAPLVVTVFVVWTLTRWALAVIGPVASLLGVARFTGDVEPAAQLATALLILVAVVVLGYLANWSVGRRLFGSAGRVVNVVPLVNTVYASIRQVANSMVEGSDRYDRVVAVEYPRQGIYGIGLVTAEAPDSFERATGEDLYAVYLPNSPNPTGGRLALVPGDQIVEVDESVRRGLRLLVTTGLGTDESATTTLDDAVLE